MTQEPERGPEPTGNRVLIAAAGCLLMAAIGGVYAWSVFVEPLQQQFGWSRTQATLPYMVLHAFVFVGTFGGGRVQDRIGPRPVALAGITLYAVGVALPALASSPGDLWLVIGGYGVLGGIGLGTAYIVPPAMLSKWFPDRRGLATGVAVGGFGGGALVAAPVGEWLIGALGSVPPVFGILGAGYLVAGVGAALLLRDPPEGYVPAGQQAGGGESEPQVQFSLGRAVRTPQFTLVTAMFALSVIIGNGLISQASSIAQDVSGVDAGVAAGLVGALGIFNAAGRPGWASLSDRLGRMTTFKVMLPLSAAVFLLMPVLGGAFPVLAVLASIAVLNYGGTFGTMPSVATDFFGTESGGAIYGLMVIAWSIGGVVGPLTMTLVHGLTGGFAPALYAFGVVALAALVVPFVTKKPAAERAEEPQPAGVE